MTNKKIYIIVLIIMSLFSTSSNAKYEKLAYNFNFKDLDGSQLKLSDYKNKVIVIVNVASKCGFTNQYEDMQKTWELYQGKGLIIIGVPSNDFGAQEPGNSEEIKNFCEANFGIDFPLTEKTNVIGNASHPFFIWAKKNYGRSAIPKWNFHKIIIGKNGKVVNTFASITRPSASKFIKVIDQELKN